MENHHVSWVNPLFQWPWLAMAGIVFSMFTGGYPFLVLDPTTKKKSYLGISGRQVGVKILVDRTEFFRALAEVGAASQLGEHTLW